MGEGVHTIKKTDRSHLHDTEGGLNRQEQYRISQLEAKIRNRKTEKGYVVGPDGQIVEESYRGTKGRAVFRGTNRAQWKDSVLTHNHPYGDVYGDSIAGRIGSLFSDTDLYSAYKTNLREIRAVTPTYTFSIRRPKSGWGNVREFMSAVQEYARNIRSGFYEYSDRQRGKLSARERQDRGNVGIQFRELKKLAKKMGWEFTRRKVK